MAEPVETPIRAISSDGSGIGSLPDGRVLFVPRTAPGDRVSVRVTQARKRWARGRLLEVLESGTDRVEPACALYDRCGGCSLQHLPYAEQLEWKRRWIEDALGRIAKRDVEIPEVVPSPSETRYRGRVTFTVRRLPGERLVAGFHRLDRPSHIVDVTDECLLPDPRILRVWAELRANWGEAGRRLPGGPKLRLTLRVADEGVGLFIQGGRSRGDVRALVRDVEGLEAVWLEDDRGKRSHGAGKETLTETWLGETFALNADTFVQVNRPASEELASWVIEQAGQGSPGTAVDAYAGVGLYGRALARAGARVAAIESDAAAVDASRSEAPEGFEAHCATVEDALEALLPTDLLVLNPPRGGLDERVTRIVAGNPPARIVYVSCNPATLARDLERLGDRYEITAARAHDLFPQTAHVETALVLDRRDSPSEAPA